MFLTCFNIRMSETVLFQINRAPVLTLWAAIVAERLGFDHDEGMTLGRAVAGLNATSKGKPTSPASVEKYLASKFGEHRDATERAMVHLAKPYPLDRLAAIAYQFYEQFRPKISSGVEGWGAKGELNLAKTLNAGQL